jgi:hypothetical protein
MKIKMKNESNYTLITCEICGVKTLKYTKHIKNSKHYFCSIACRSKRTPWNKGKIGYRRSDYGKAMIAIKCFACGKEFKRYKSFLGKYRNFCSPECRKSVPGLNKGKPLSEKHKQKLCENHADFKGENSPSWRGGYNFKGFSGYVGVWTPDGYVLQHRLVMEQYLGRKLTDEEEVHHKNFNRQDNRIENLQLFASKAEHMAFHMQLRLEQNEKQ